MENPPGRRAGELDPVFWAPDIAPSPDASVPSAPPNAYLRKRRGYTPEPVEESVPTPTQDPRVTYLVNRSFTTGEVQYPIDEAVKSVSMVPTHGFPEFLGAEHLQKYEERVRVREGSRILIRLWFWTITTATLGFLSLVSSLWASGLHGFGLSGPTVLAMCATCFALGVLTRTVTSYGWLPWARLIFLRVSRQRDIVEWRRGYGAAERLELQRRVKE